MSTISTYEQADELLQRGTRIVCAADQAPFDVRHNTFSVLCPLITADGAKVDPDRRSEAFPNYGRIWWMVMEDRPEEIMPGMLFSAQIEMGIQRDRHVFQVRRISVRPGADDFLEVITVAGDVDPLALLQGETLRTDHAPTSEVLVADDSGVVGPFSAQWDRSTGSVTLSVLRQAEPVIHRLPRKTVSAEEFMTFEYMANQFDSHRDPERQMTVALAPKSLLSKLRSDGHPFDAANDRQVMNWAFQFLDVPNRDEGTVKAVIDQLRGSGALSATDAPPGRVVRLREICDSTDRVMGLGAEVAERLAGQPAFLDLVESHVGTILAERMAAEVERRRDEIEAQTAELDERRARLEARTAALEENYQAQLREQEEALQQAHAERLRGLAAREATVAAAEEGLEAREAEMAARLQRVLDLYETKATELGDQILATAPVLHRLGAADGRSGRGADRSSTPTTLTLPSFLGTAKPDSNLEEGAFLEQFAAVARRRGFVYDDDDLANFHITVKTGEWTVVAGPSGTGKSSLPLLYAEALGDSDELLWVPVRPDWMDDRDVIGAYNALAGRFEPAACGLVDRLIAAHLDRVQGRGGMYLVCLDEMNLARVEHYFAQVMSVLELPADRRVLTLFGAGLTSAADPYGPYRVLPIEDNVRFVGTVNVDETTHFFSPKVLDRTAILILEEPKLGVTPPADEGVEAEPVHADTYRTWIRTPAADVEGDKLLLDLNDVLRRDRAAIGYRTRDRFLKYLASAEGLLTPDRAFDLAFAQLVLPRLRLVNLRTIERLQARLPEAS